MKIGVLKIILFGPMLLSIVGCGNSVIEEMTLDLAKGYCAQFKDDELDGCRVYGYDASYLHGSIVELMAKERDKLDKMSKPEFEACFPLVYFVALKYENEFGSNSRQKENKCFRIQFGAIDLYHAPASPESPRQERSSSTKCYTFFLVAEDDHVEVLSVDLTRNPKNGPWRQGRYFSYGSTNAKIRIWDACMTDRNRPEKILEGKYKKAFAVMTDRPFNYMPYTASKRLELVELLHGDAIYRLCWQTPECMIFVPEALLPCTKDGVRKSEGR